MADVTRSLRLEAGIPNSRGNAWVPASQLLALLDIAEAARELVRQVEISGAVDDRGHRLINLKALADTKAALSRLGGSDG